MNIRGDRARLCTCDLTISTQANQSNRKLTRNLFTELLLILVIDRSINHFGDHWNLTSLPRSTWLPLFNNYELPKQDAGAEMSTIVKRILLGIILPDPHVVFGVCFHDLDRLQNSRPIVDTAFESTFSRYCSLHLPLDRRFHQNPLFNHNFIRDNFNCGGWGQKIILFAALFGTIMRNQWMDIWVVVSIVQVEKVAQKNKISQQKGMEFPMKPDSIRDQCTQQFDSGLVKTNRTSARPSDNTPEYLSLQFSPFSRPKFNYPSELISMVAKRISQFTHTALNRTTKNAIRVIKS